MHTLPHDLRQAARILRRAPAFAAAALVTLALGIGLVLPLLGLVEAGSALRFDPFGVADGSFASGIQAPLDAPREATRSLPEHPLGGALWTEEARSIAAIQGEGLGVLLRILAAGSYLVLGIVCTSMLLLLLVRATARQREMALRAVLGGGRGRVLRQLLADGLILGTLGGFMGALLGTIGFGVLHASWPEGMARWLGRFPEARAAALALGVPLLATLLVGLAPALGARESDLHATLTTGGRATAGPGEGAVRSVLIVAAVAASVMLLTGAGLLLRGFLSAQAGGGEGLDPRQTLTLQLDLPASRYPDAGERAAFLVEIQRRIEALPGIVDTSVASRGAWMGLGVEDRVRAVCPECSRGLMILPVTRAIARHHVVGPGFFAAHGVPPMRGREFTPEDVAEAPAVAVINEAFAYQLFPRGEPLGKQIQVGGPDGRWYTVIGIAPSIRARGIGMGSEAAPALYLSALQHPPRAVGLAVRTWTDPLAVVPAVEGAILAVDPRQIPYGSMTMEEQLARFRAPLRWFALLFGALAVLAVVLSAHGLYGVISYHVSRRTREIGIRMALGARVRQVVEMVLRQSVRLSALGMLFGLWGALSLARLLQVLFLGIRPLDPVVYGSTFLLLGAVALLASYRPARRAAGVDPTIALQTE